MLTYPMNNDKSKKKNFTRTCSRLSHFLKERRPLGDQSCFAFPQMAPPYSFKLNPKRAEEEFGSKKGTVSLFPKKMEGPEGDVSAGTKEIFKSLNLFPLTSPSTEESPQNIITNIMRESPSPMEAKISASMTIFYGGQVLVFNEFSEEAAEEIMSLARQGTIANTLPQTSFQTQIQTPTAPLDYKTIAYQHNENLVPEEFGSPSDLPIARRTSLYRFMEKRKDRIASAAPYQHNSFLAMASSNPQRHDVLMGNICEQQQQQLVLKL